MSGTDADGDVAAAAALECIEAEVGDIDEAVAVADEGADAVEREGLAEEGVVGGASGADAGADVGFTDVFKMPDGSVGGERGWAAEAVVLLDVIGGLGEEEAEDGAGPGGAADVVEGGLLDALVVGDTVGFDDGVAGAAVEFSEGAVGVVEVDGDFTEAAFEWVDGVIGLGAAEGDAAVAEVFEVGFAAGGPFAEVAALNGAVGCHHDGGLRSEGGPTDDFFDAATGFDEGFEGVDGERGLGLVANDVALDEDLSGEGAVFVGGVEVAEVEVAVLPGEVGIEAFVGSAEEGEALQFDRASGGDAEGVVGGDAEIAFAFHD